jgi:hypothetical protein
MMLFTQHFQDKEDVSALKKFCAMKTCTALLPQFIAMRVEPSDFLTGVHEVYGGLTMVSMGWLWLYSSWAGLSSIDAM